jgi:hypothetical protein
VSDPLFYFQEYQKEVMEAFEKMYNYLHENIEEGGVKTKLHDQLIWLQYQIKYFQSLQNFDLLQENFNWVIANFNHDLSLSEDQAFTKIQKK